MRLNIKSHMFSDILQDDAEIQARESCTQTQNGLVLERFRYLEVVTVYDLSWEGV